MTGTPRAWARATSSARLVRVAKRELPSSSPPRKVTAAVRFEMAASNSAGVAPPRIADLDEAGAGVAVVLGEAGEVSLLDDDLVAGAFPVQVGEGFDFGGICSGDAGSSGDGEAGGGATDDGGVFNRGGVDELGDALAGDAVKLGEINEPGRGLLHGLDDLGGHHAPAEDGDSAVGVDDAPEAELLVEVHGVRER